MTWLLWALTCAFGMAMADASTKRGLGALSARQLLIARCILPLIVLVPLALVTWPDDVPLATWAWLIPSAILEVIAVGFYLRSIQGADLSQSLPFHAFTPGARWPALLARSLASRSAASGWRASCWCLAVPGCSTSASSATAGTGRSRRRCVSARHG